MPVIDARAAARCCGASSYEHRTLPGVGHVVPDETPEEVADAILELTRSVSLRGRHAGANR
jgi:pimeloyl-ACP methyl ester carboxylesterase